MSVNIWLRLKTMGRVFDVHVLATEPSFFFAAIFCHPTTSLVLGSNSLIDSEAAQPWSARVANYQIFWKELRQVRSLRNGGRHKSWLFQSIQS